MSESLDWYVEKLRGADNAVVLAPNQLAYRVLYEQEFRDGVLCVNGHEFIADSNQGGFVPSTKPGKAYLRTQTGKELATKAAKNWVLEHLMADKRLLQYSPGTELSAMYRNECDLAASKKRQELERHRLLDEPLSRGCKQTSPYKAEVTL